jgi:tetraacyldisaccharide 4'-kinase
MLSLIAYNLILASFLPVILAWGLWRLARGKSRQGWAQRFGLLGETAVQAKRKRGISQTPRIWVHACSVGEVNAVRPVIQILRKRLPDALIFLSTITPTGQAQARRFCKEADSIFYFPFDVLPCMWLALRRLRPDLCILTEKELWPNFLALCRINEIPVVVVNAIVSDRTVSRAKWFGGFMRWLAGMVTFFSAQTEQYRSRLLALRVKPQRIGVDGNTKFDKPAPEPGKEKTLAELLGWGPETLSLAAGSTHAGEEEVVLEAFQRLRRKHPMARLLIAPRHPERTSDVASRIEKSGLRWVRRSELQAEPSGGRSNAEGWGANKVVILDTIGELPLAYRLAKAAFVGGSLVSHVGGHDPLEVAAEGKPVFFGPHMRNCRDIASLLQEEEVGFMVRNAAELAAGWQRALEDKEWLAEMEQRTSEVMLRHRGGSHRAAERVLKILSEQSRKREKKAEAAQRSEAMNERLGFQADSPLARGKEYLLEVVEGRKQGFLPDALRAGLTGLSCCYWAGLTANLALYDVRLLHRKRVRCPVIGIGNITLGGTGKTLAVFAACQWLLKKGLTPAILSRGYGGNSSVSRLVFDGERLILGPEEAGDEPFLLAASLPGARVVVGKDRRRSADMAYDIGAQVMVLDDGFQYWKLEKDFEIVLVDALNPFANGRLFPRGLLREFPAALRRADALWITHSDLVSTEELETLEEDLAEIAPGVSITRTIHHPVALRDFASGDRIGLWTLEGKRILALSGLGNPFSFELMLRRLGAEVIPARFPDHHTYQREEIASLLEERGNINMIVTTAKDAVRLPGKLTTDIPLRVLEVKLAGYADGQPMGIERLLDEAFAWLTADM